MNKIVIMGGLCPTHCYRYRDAAAAQPQGGSLQECNPRSDMPQYRREQWVLAKRITGAPAEENFNIVEEDVPELRKGDILCRALYISVDPITR